MDTGKCRSAVREAPPETHQKDTALEAWVQMGPPHPGNQHRRERFRRAETSPGAWGEGCILGADACFAGHSSGVGGLGESPFPRSVLPAAYSALATPVNTTVPPSKSAATEAPMRPPRLRRQLPPAPSWASDPTEVLPAVVSRFDPDLRSYAVEYYGLAVSGASGRALPETAPAWCAIVPHAIH